MPDLPGIDPDLDHLTRAWPTLSETVRRAIGRLAEAGPGLPPAILAGIGAMIDAAAGPGTDPTTHTHERTAGAGQCVPPAPAK